MLCHVQLELAILNCNRSNSTLHKNPFLSDIEQNYPFIALIANIRKIFLRNKQFNIFRQCSVQCNLL